MNAIIENMMTRRSVRAFKKDPVPTELIEQVIEAGTWAASGHDRQPWALIAVTNPEVIAKLSKANASFFEHDVKDPFYGAPAIIIVLTKTFTPTYLYDGSLAMGNMMLAAHSLGLGSCWIHRARQEFKPTPGRNGCNHWALKENTKASDIWPWAMSTANCQRHAPERTGACSG